GGEQRGERPEGQLYVVLAEQRLVVRDHLVRRASVVEDGQLDPAAENTAVGVHVLGPELVPPLERLAVSGEVSGQRQRRADGDRARGLARRGGSAARGARARARGQGTQSEHGHGGHGEYVSREPRVTRSHAQFLLPFQASSGRSRQDASASSPPLVIPAGRAPRRRIRRILL